MMRNKVTVQDAVIAVSVMESSMQVCYAMADTVRKA